MEMMSASIADLAKALAAAQQDMNPASKNATNPMLRNKYADLSSCIAAAREVLPKHGLSYTQVLDSSEAEKVTVTTILMHESGQWIQSSCTLPCLTNKGVNPAQAAGSAITYARRYGLSSIIGLATDDDDDGCASGPMNQQQQNRQQRPVPAQQTQQLSVLDRFKRFIMQQGAKTAEEAFQVAGFLLGRNEPITSWNQISEEEMINIMKQAASAAKEQNNG